MERIVELAAAGLVMIGVVLCASQALLGAPLIA